MVTTSSQHGLWLILSMLKYGEVSFSFSLFIDIHDWTEAKHDYTPNSATAESRDPKYTYSWLSSVCGEGLHLLRLCYMVASYQHITG